MQMSGSQLDAGLAAFNRSVAHRTLELEAADTHRLEALLAAATFSTPLAEGGCGSVRLVCGLGA